MMTNKWAFIRTAAYAGIMSVLTIVAFVITLANWRVFPTWLNVITAGLLGFLAVRSAMRIREAVRVYKNR